MLFCKSFVQTSKNRKYIPLVILEIGSLRIVKNSGTHIRNISKTGNETRPNVRELKSAIKTKVISSVAGHDWKIFICHSNWNSCCQLQSSLQRGAVLKPREKSRFVFPMLTPVRPRGRHSRAKLKLEGDVRRQINLLLHLSASLFRLDRLFY